MQDPTAPIATLDREVKLAGRTILVRDDKPTFWARVGADAWEPGVIAAISELVTPGDVFLDLGAWVGPTTLLAALHGADCLAVEADPAALGELRANLAANPELARRVTVLDRAISPDTAPVELAARRKPGDSMSSVLLAQARRHGDGSAGSGAVWRSPAVTPQELAGLVAPDRSLFIKLDIEGGEFALLPQMTPLLQRPSATGAETRLLASFHPGILRETGVGESQIAAAVASALAPLAGWESQMITDSGAEVAQPEPDRIATGHQGDAWLFRRPRG